MENIIASDATRQMNGRVMDLMSLYLNLGADLISEEMLLEVKNAANCTEERAYAELLGAICELDVCGKDKAFFRDYFVPMIHRQEVQLFQNDPYYQRVKDLHFEEENWTLKMMELKPYEAFVCGDFQVDAGGRMLPQIGYFSKAYAYPAVLENGREWMTLLPNETLTTFPALEAAHGRVLTYGLGLGYFAVRSAFKNNVEHVTVVEKSPQVIRLFREHLLPCFREVEKRITIIESDAFDFAATLRPGDYDFVFADIWHDVGDGRPLWHRFKQFEKNCPSAQYYYWLEDTMKYYEMPGLWPSREVE